MGEAPTPPAADCMLVFPRSCWRIEDEEEAIVDAPRLPPGVTVSEVERRDEFWDELNATGTAALGGGGEAPLEL